MRTLQLVLGSNVLDFGDDADHGITVTSPNVGYPAPREVLTDLPGQDGQFDETAYFGTRLVTLTGSFGPGRLGSRSVGLGLFAPFVAPGARPQLIYAFDDDVYERMLTMRASDFTAPPSNGTEAPFTASWKCADPIAYALNTNDLLMLPASVDSSGITFPLTFPLTFGGSTYGGDANVPLTTNGNYPTWPVFQIFGPITDPKIQWVDPATLAVLETQVVFSGITVADGDYLEVDVRAQTVLLNGDPLASRYSFVDFANTEWGPLEPGLNMLRFSGSSATDPCIAHVLWRDAFLI